MTDHSNPTCRKCGGNMKPVALTGCMIWPQRGCEIYTARSVANRHGGIRDDQHTRTYLGVVV